MNMHVKIAFVILHTLCELTGFTLPSGGQPGLAVSRIDAVPNVANAAQLLSALSHAKAGDVIMLSAGNYGAVSLSGLHFSSDVTIVSADREQPAMFDTLKISQSSHLVIDGIAAAHALKPGEPNYAATVSIDKSSFVTLKNSEISGSSDGNYRNDGQGLAVTNSSQIVVAGNEFHDLKSGIGAGKSDGVTLSGNDIHDIRSDGILIGAVNNVLIEGNTIGTFHTAQDLGDHPDMIQVFNNNASRDMENVTIRNNVLIQGSGDNVQGIFVQGVPPGLAGSYPFVARNFLIEGNVVSVGAAQGVWVADVTGATIRLNTVVADPQYGILPLIQTNRTIGAVVTGNVAMGFVDLASTGTVASNNITATITNPYADTYIGNLFSDPWATLLTKDSLAPNPLGVLHDVGAVGLDTSQKAIIAVDHRSMPDVMTYVFDGGFSPRGSGAITDYVWDFGDGTSAHGLRVTHAYQHAGLESVSLTVMFADGTAKTSTATINVLPENVLDLHLDHGLGNSSEAAIGAIAKGALNYVAGIRGEAVLFNGQAMTAGGNAVLVNQGAENLLNGMPQLTASLWFEKTALSAGTERVLGLNGSYAIELVGQSSARFILNTDSGQAITLNATGLAIADTRWHQVVMTYDGQKLSAYIDGALVASQGGLSGHLKPLGARKTL